MKDFSLIINCLIAFALIFVVPYIIGDFIIGDLEGTLVIDYFAHYVIKILIGLPTLVLSISTFSSIIALFVFFISYIIETVKTYIDNKKTNLLFIKNKKLNILRY